MSSIANDVSIAELQRHVEAIAQWVRLSGTPDEARAFDYIEEVLTGFGYEVQRHECDALIGYPLEASLELLGDAPRSFRANGYSFTPSTPEEGLSGELVYVGQGLPADYEGVDARGKIVLSEGLANPGKALAAQRAGAIGQIHINKERIYEMCVSPVWGTPTPETADLLPKLPAIGITRADGETLKALLENGPVQVRFTSRTHFDWGKLPTLTADLPGVEEDRYVLFSGHVDSWHYGAMDNGTANATQLEVARLLAERKNELRRGVRLAFWSGHSHSRYAGSAWYADTFWHDIHERCVCHVNVDSVGGKGATLLDIAPTMASTYGFAREIMREQLGVDLKYQRMGRFSDQSFWGHGVPALFATFSAQPDDDTLPPNVGGGGPRGGGLGWWWHTPEDTLDKIDPEFFERDARVYAVTLWRLCTDERLPFDYAAVADDLAATLERYETDSGGALDLCQARELAGQLASALRGGALDKLDAEAANQLVLELGHVLIPVDYTRSGQFGHDLALPAPPIPGLSDARKLKEMDPDSSDYRFLLTRLLRERNRVEHALRAALKRVKQAAGS